MAERYRFKPGTNVDVAHEHPGPSTVECLLCGTRLRRNDEPGVTDVGADSFTTVARHRCVGRVKPHAIAQQ